MHDVQSRRVARKRDMAQLVAEAAGLCEDEWDLDLFSAPLNENLSSFMCSRPCVFNVLGGTPAFLDEIC